VHREVGGSNDLSVLAADAGNGESQKRPYGAKPPDRRGDVCGECKLAEAGCHCHEVSLSVLLHPCHAAPLTVLAVSWTDSSPDP
jgi:hypothetical protein